MVSCKKINIYWNITLDKYVLTQLNDLSNENQIK